jgi:hypothetical protein
VPQTPLYIHSKPEGITSFPEAYRLMKEKYEGQPPPPTGDLAGDEKTIETSSSTPLAAALDPEFDGILFHSRLWRLHATNCLASREIRLVSEELQAP